MLQTSNRPLACAPVGHLQLQWQCIHMLEEVGGRKATVATFAPCDWNFVFDGGTCPDCPGIVITARVTAEVGVQLRGSAQPHVLGSTGSLGLSNGGRLGQARSAGVCIADCPVSGAANDGPLSARLYPLRRMRHSHSWAAVGRLPQGRGCTQK